MAGGMLVKLGLGLLILALLLPAPIYSDGTGAPTAAPTQAVTPSKGVSIVTQQPIASLFVVSLSLLLRLF